MDTTKGNLCLRCLVLAGVGLAPAGAESRTGASGKTSLDDLAELSRTAPLNGEPFGDYVLLEEIARGGMGVVYKAHQTSLDRIVAVKLLPFGALTNPASVKRFQAEASAAASLQHPNIVTVHEVGVHEGQHYLVMNFINGPPLSRLVAQGPLSAKRAATYVKTVAEAVHHAHEHGILHRDIKPSNMLIDENDQPQVTDFGLAKRLDGESSLTLTGHVLGSPNYLAPEQASSDHGRVTCRTDVYGLGATLYHLLTGRPPFQAATLNESIQQVLNAEPAAPRLLDPNVPRDLETICLKCLEKEPERRYETAEAMARELERFLNEQPVLARPIGPAGRTWRWCRRRPVVAGLGVALILTFAVGLTGVLSQSHRAAANERLAIQNAYAADMRHARESLEKGDFGTALSLLNKYGPERLPPAVFGSRSPANLRNWEWHYLWRLWPGDEQSALSKITTPEIAPPDRTLPVIDPTFSRDRLAVVALGPDNAVCLWDSGSAEPIESLPMMGTNNSAVALSPDGRWLATVLADRSAIRIWDWTTRRAVTNLSIPSRPVVVSFSPMGWLMAGGFIPIQSERNSASRVGAKLWWTNSWTEIPLSGIDMTNGSTAGKIRFFTGSTYQITRHVLSEVPDDPYLQGIINTLGPPSSMLSISAIHIDNVAGRCQDLTLQINYCGIAPSTGRVAGYFYSSGVTATANGDMFEWRIAGIGQVEEAGMTIQYVARIAGGTGRFEGSWGMAWGKGSGTEPYPSTFEGVMSTAGSLRRPY